MEISLKHITLLTALILTGLSAGFFYAWSVSVIPGTRKVVDSTYLEVMQHINREILNPRFFLVFFGSLIALAISTIQHYGNGVSFWLLLAATLTYLVGTLAVTGLGNVPLNDQLEALKLGELAPSQMTDFRSSYESRWNAFHRIRTIASVAAFLIALLAAFTSVRDHLN